MNRYVFDEIMKLPSDNSVSVSNSIVKLFGLVSIKLLNEMNTEFNKCTLFYQVSINDILKSKITNDDLVFIRNAGWEIKGDNIVRFL